MKKIAIFASLFFLLSTMGNAQVAGSWHGKLNTPVGALTIVIHIQDSTGHYSATMDSPDQNAKDIPVSKINFGGNVLQFQVGNGVINYEGTLISDSISGTFKQSGLSLPLTFYKGSAKETTHQRPQLPKPPFPYRSEDITFTNPDAQNISLAATLTLPGEGSNFPAVVLISGSGPQDRDETIMEHQPFLVIADYLTRNGIAVLRFDDRGTAQSQGDFTTATTADFATDVKAAANYLKSRKEINTKKIGLIGHSEGGIIAPMVAASDHDIAFIVLLAGPGVNGKEILLMQSKLISEKSGSTPGQVKQLTEANRQIYTLVLNSKNDSLLETKLIEKLAELMPAEMDPEQKKNAARSQAAQMSSPWMKYFSRNDPADYLRKLKIPVLALNGSLDVQVPAQQNITAINDALQKAGNTRVKTHIFPGLNHLFQHAKTGMPDEYIQIEETIAPEVLKCIKDWIREQTE